MAKREKSKRLYALMVIDKTEARDKSLSELLDIEYKVEASLISQFICGSLGYLGATHNLEYIKSWKTIAGVEKFRDNLQKTLNNNPTKTLHLCKFDLSSYMESGIISTLGVEEVPYSNIATQLVDITDLWNLDIERRIETENQRHELTLKRLDKKRI
jgi:hypothetical protein